MDFGLLQTIDEDMAEYCQLVGKKNFLAFCECTLQCLFDEIERMLLRRERKRGFGLLDPNVSTAADLAVFESDRRSLINLFSNELSPATIRELGRSYDGVLAQLKRRMATDRGLA